MASFQDQYKSFVFVWLIVYMCIYIGYQSYTIDPYAAQRGHFLVLLSSALYEMTASLMLTHMSRGILRVLVILKIAAAVWVLCVDAASLALVFQCTDPYCQDDLMTWYRLGVIASLATLSVPSLIFASLDCRDTWSTTNWTPKNSSSYVCSRITLVVVALRHVMPLLDSTWDHGRTWLYVATWIMDGVFLLTQVAGGGQLTLFGVTWIVGIVQVGAQVARLVADLVLDIPWLLSFMVLTAVAYEHLSMVVHEAGQEEDGERDPIQNTTISKKDKEEIPIQNTTISKKDKEEIALWVPSMATDRNPFITNRSHKLKL